MTTETLERTEVQTLAANVAAGIREHGHYQRGYRPGGHCVILNPYIHSGNIGAFVNALGFPNAAVAVHWNDNTPTADVLARLDAIANGESA